MGRVLWGSDHIPTISRPLLGLPFDSPIFIHSLPFTYLHLAPNIPSPQCRPVAALRVTQGNECKVPLNKIQSLEATTGRYDTAAVQILEWCPDRGLGSRIVILMASKPFIRVLFIQLADTVCFQLLDTLLPSPSLLPTSQRPTPQVSMVEALSIPSLRQHHSNYPPFI